MFRGLFNWNHSGCNWVPVPYTIVLEKLMSAHVINKFPTFYEAQCLVYSNENSYGIFIERPILILFSNSLFIRWYCSWIYFWEKILKSTDVKITTKFAFHKAQTLRLALSSRPQRLGCSPLEGSRTTFRYAVWFFKHGRSNKSKNMQQFSDIILKKSLHESQDMP